MKASAIAILFLLFATSVALANVSPSSIDITLPPGESFVTDVDVSTDEISQKLDIVFVIDDTGSMGNEIASIKAGATAFMNSLDGVSDAQFGIVSFDDPASDTVFHHDLSDDFASVQTSLNSIVASGGGDCPEFAISGLSVAANDMTWRPGSERIIFLITDAGVKDANIPANNLLDTTATLVAEGIAVNTLAHVSGCNYSDPIYQGIADATGGEARYGLTASDNPIDEMVDILDPTVTVVPTPVGCEPLVITFDPTEQTVNSGDTAIFEMTILAPLTPFDTVTCTVEMRDEDGLVLDTLPISVASNGPPHG